MNRYAFYETTTALFLMLAAHPAAHADIREPSACRLPAQLLNDAARPAPTTNALPPGCQTSTLPWSAPVGHRQPQANDVVSETTSSIDQEVEKENAKIDQLIKGVCRGC
jgi:hypothetical protein